MHLVNRRITMGGAVALGLSVFLVAPAAHADEAGSLPGANETIYVSSGFDQQLSDTRANGHYEVVGTGLHVWTDGNADLGTDGHNSDKVAEYVDTNTPLSAVDNASLDYTPTDPSANLTGPGFQLVVDLDNDGTKDGILVGEPGFYGNHWWLSDASPTFLASIDPEVPGAAPAPGRNDGYAHSGPLAEWLSDFSSAQVLAFGFSLGSGVHGDGTINAINFAGTRYTFDAIVLTSKDECKGGGWAKSTLPAYSNQGECVSHFATASNNGNGKSKGDAGLGAPVSTPTATGATTVLTARNSGKIRAI